MNRKLLAIAVAGAVAPMAAQAVDFSISGTIDRAIRFADNGDGSDIQHVSGPSPTHFAFAANGEPMPGIIAGGRIEAGWAANSAGGRDVDGPDASPAISYRHSYLYFKGDFGRITMGHTNPAGKSAMFGSHNNSGAWAGTEYSIDHTTAISVMATDGMPYACVPSTNATHQPQDDGTIDHERDEESCGYSVWSFMPSINIGRANVLRYNSPQIGPVTFEASIQKDDADSTSHQWNFGAKVSQDIGAANVIGRLHIKEDVLALSGGIKFANGTSVNAAWGKDEDGKNPMKTARQDFEDIYVNLSHSWGNMSVAIDYRTSDDRNTDLEGRKIGLGTNYAVGEGVNVYAGFHNYSFDAPDMNFEDVNSFHIGTSVSF